MEQCSGGSRDRERGREGVRGRAGATMRRRSAGFISLSLCMPERERAGGGASSPRPFLLSLFRLRATSARRCLALPPSLSCARVGARVRPRQPRPSFSVADRLSVRPCLSARGERPAEAVYDGWGERTGGRLSLPLSTLPPPVVVGFLKLSR